jgi:quercetin dioxygenase-like cupin family protein
MMTVRYGEWHDAGEGVRRRIFAPGQAIMSMEIEFRAGASGAAHSHPHEQITHVTAGKIAVTVEGTRHVIGAGEQLCVPGDAVHSVLALEDSRVLETFTPLREDLLRAVSDH